MFAVVVAAAAAVLGDCGCVSGSSCCKDSTGYVCCIDHVTACVPADGAYPARCCPRWTVACSVGSVGCCDPAHPWQRAVPAPSPPVPAPPPEPTQSPVTLHALFLSGLLSQALHVHSFLPSGGASPRYPSARKVTGPAASWYKGSFANEGTRLFAFSPVVKAFYYVDAGAAAGDVVLVKVDAATGTSALDVAVSLPSPCFPRSFAYDAASGAVVFAVELAGGARVAYYSVAVDAGKTRAAAVATLRRDVGSEGAPSYYAAYFAAPGGPVLHRLGFRFESNGTSPGVLRTTLPDDGSGGEARAKWTPVDAGLVPDKAAFYYSLDADVSTVARSGGLNESFLSLAPTAAGFELVRWNPYATATCLLSRPALVAVFTHVYPPGEAGVGTLGYVGTATNARGFFGVAMRHAKTAQAHGSLPYDEWVVLSHDALLNATAVNPLQLGFSLADGVTLAGFGAEAVSWM
eukprot:Rhum_TRINITY_DN5157_c0_g1::Rhum_TRINITY_DN5157_c0_g1_i1::g.16646::m.16646